MQKNRKTKIICIFGGVYSSLGKGVIAASITRILKELKNDVEMIKLEPYLNVNSGLMSPYQHGEVYVTHDGGETDLDLGTYERLGGARVSAIQYITSGQVYHDIITRERAGKYNGKTIQVVPHVTNLFKEKIFDVIRIKKPAFLVIEIGGTVGDMESLPIVEALCQIQKEIGRDNFLPILCAPLIHLKGTSGELKTKPCQHAYLELSKLGIKAEFLILRSEEPIGSDIYEKMQAHCHIDKNNIFLARTLPSVYFLPSELYIQKIHRQIYRFFNLKLNPHANINHWNTYINGIKKIHRTITIGMVGKYMELHDSYSSVIEALRLAG
jgi:CTP synthase